LVVTTGVGAIGAVFVLLVFDPAAHTVCGAASITAAKKAVPVLSLCNRSRADFEMCIYASIRA
jgi:hypothetical protein